MKTTTSKQPRKQRKQRQNAPLHARQRAIASPLSKELKAKYKRNAIGVRQGDVVIVTRGAAAKKSGEVTRVDYARYKVYVDGVTRKKSDGTDVQQPLDPSNLVITDLYVEDKQRRAILERKLS